jgi:hypothetical protein
MSRIVKPEEVDALLLCLAAKPTPRTPTCSHSGSLRLRLVKGADRSRF